MLGMKTIEQVLHTVPVISSDMQNAIELWSDMYEDKAPWLKQPTYNDPVTVVSLGLPAFIASEKARMVTLEMKSEITAPEIEIQEPAQTQTGTSGAKAAINSPQNANNQQANTNNNTTENSAGNANIQSANANNANITPNANAANNNTQTANSNTARAEYMNKQYQKKVISKIREQIEYGIAKGGLVIKPYFVPNDEPELSDEKGELEFDFIQADCFYPLAFDASGKITEAAFIQRKIDKNDIYTRLEHHILQKNQVIVRNRAFKNTNASNQNTTTTGEVDLGREISLTDVPEWAGLEPETTIKNVDRLLFAYFKMPEANTVDTHSPLGVSAYSRAIRQIEEADKQFSRMLWEFEGGELAIDIDRDALMSQKDSDGKIVEIRPELQQRLFRKIDLGDSATYNVFNPPFRDAALINGLNNILMRIEDICGLARGTVADVSAEARTATELRILKQRTYSSVTDIQTKALQPCLEDLAYIMDVYCTLYNIVGDSTADENTGIVDTNNIGKYSISFEWDDSTITDAETELSKRIMLMQNGISSKLEVRMWYFGETEEQAREALQKIEQESAQAMLANMQAMQGQGQEEEEEQEPRGQQQQQGQEEKQAQEKQKQTQEQEENAEQQ